MGAFSLSSWTAGQGAAPDVSLPEMYGLGMALALLGDDSRVSALANSRGGLGSTS